MATAHLVIPNEQRSALLAVGRRLPSHRVEDMFRAGDLLGLDLAVVRTIARLGDDRVVLCELLDPTESSSDAVDWIDLSRLDRRSSARLL